ncbi:MAG TPA: YhjD/YihY/BrkB family envelope integrity protein [Actinomycetes bacterium]|nr:YhjD/YihY/BrkB family envelope integrity protein [Actinomycetes bacterium]
MPPLLVAPEERPPAPLPEPTDVNPAPLEIGPIRPLAALTRRDDTLGRVAKRLADSVVIAIVVDFVRLGGRDRVLVLAGQAFTTIIPLFILMAAVSSNPDYVADNIIRRFNLTDGAAEAVKNLFARPPGTTGAITVVGALLLFFSVLSFTKSLQRTYEAAWRLPPAGVRGTLFGLSGIVLLVGQVVLLTLIASLLHRAPAGTVLTFLVRVAIASFLWWQLQYLLLTRRVPRRLLVPGAVTSGLGQIVISVYSAAWMPHLVRINAARYGVIGVTFALLTWFIVICFGAVLTAIISAQFGERAKQRQDSTAAS